MPNLQTAICKDHKEEEYPPALQWSTTLALILQTGFILHESVWQVDL